MKHPANLLAIVVVCLASISELTPTPSAQGRDVSSVQVIDVALDENGRLNGRLTNRHGDPLANREVWIKTARQSIAETPVAMHTTSNGGFQSPKLRGGVYFVEAGGECIVARCWSAGTSPPNSNHAILLVTNDFLARGNHAKRLTPGYIYDAIEYRPMLFYGAATTAIVLPIVLLDDDDAS